MHGWAISNDSASLHRAVRAVMQDAAERAILPRFRKLEQHQVREKAANELVTVADYDSEAFLAEGLAKILPDAAIIGEEAAAADPSILRHLGAPLCWIIDPLDGTANFAAGKGPFGMLVALARHGTPVGGWIYDPRSSRFCCALRGNGTFVNGEAVRAQASNPDRPIAAISSLFVEPRRAADILRRLETAFTTVPIPRCAAEQYPRLVLGTNDLTLFERTLPWDHAAGVLCLTEAGGFATRFDGSAYRVDDERRGLVAAATPEIWRTACDLLQGLA